MNSLLAFILAAWAGPMVVCGLRIDPTAEPPYAGIGFGSYARTVLPDREFIARTILAEQGGRILDPDLRMDSIGVAFVVMSRSRLGASIPAVVLAPGQFNGITASGNVLRAIDPDAYSLWYGPDNNSGRLAYWTAIAISQCVMTGQITDPTHGAMFFSDHYYVKDTNGNLLIGPSGSHAIANYLDGRTRFRIGFNDASYPIESKRVEWRLQPECIGVEWC